MVFARLSSAMAKSGETPATKKYLLISLPQKACTVEISAVAT